jgi:hypothetical protein
MSAPSALSEATYICPHTYAVAFGTMSAREFYRMLHCPRLTPSDKHVLNTPQTLVVDSLKGLVALNPNIKLDEAQRGMYEPQPR